MLVRKLLLLLGLSCFYFLPHTQAQFSESLESAGERSQATPLSIPLSPAYQLLDAGATLVNQPSSIHEIKVDWSFKSYNLSPNLSLELQPVWMLFYEREPLLLYQSSSGLMRKLSTASVSIGTLGNDSINQLAIAAKINLFHRADPLMDQAYLARVDWNFKARRDSLLNLIKIKTDSLRMIKDPYANYALRGRIVLLQGELGFLEDEKKQAYDKASRVFQRAHWNAAALDIAFGKVYNYWAWQDAEDLALKDEGIGIWLSGCVGIGRAWLLSGLLRYTQFGENKQVSGGLNLKYGSNRFHFFAEALYQRPPEDLTLPRQMTIAYGGDFKVSRKVLLNFAIRTVYQEQLQFKNLLPVVSLHCLMQ